MLHVYAFPTDQKLCMDNVKWLDPANVTLGVKSCRKNGTNILLEYSLSIREQFSDSKKSNEYFTSIQFEYMHDQFSDEAHTNKVCRSPVTKTIMNKGYINCKNMISLTASIEY